LNAKKLILLVVSVVILVASCRKKDDPVAKFSNCKIAKKVDTGQSAIATINSGYFVSEPYIALENTNWKGTLQSSGLVDFQLKFLPSIKAEAKVGSATDFNLPYSRTTNGGCLRFKDNSNIFYFGVITSATDIKGSRYTSDYPFQITRQ